ncbi:MAG: hypothetical protein JF622_11385 [Terrabacter sp.]|nr:hypothetical protein [Terrabacter sp.]
MLQIVEPDETALDRLDDDTTRRSLIRSLMGCVDDSAREAPEAERAALDHPFVQQGRAPDVDPGDPPGPAWCRHQNPDGHRHGRAHDPVERGSGGSCEPRSVAADELRSDEPLPLRRQAGLKRVDTGQQEPPVPADPPAQGLAGDTGFQELTPGQHCVLHLGKGCRRVGQGHSLTLPADASGGQATGEALDDGSGLVVGVDRCVIRSMVCVMVG